MKDFRDRIAKDWAAVLQSVLARAGELGSRAVVAFDLDSTVFDNRPRQARIAREFGADRGVEALVRCGPKDFDSGWDPRSAFERCGLSRADADRIYPDFKRFWAERFFTSAYCQDDVAVRGAPEYLRALIGAEARICYVTGRHEGMRDGTLASMGREGLPVPGDQVSVMFKPQQDMDDDDFKRQAHAELPRLGTVIAAFDNEPIHVNDYRARFPRAVVVHVATDHSGRELRLAEGVPSIPHF